MKLKPSRKRRRKLPPNCYRVYFHDEAPSIGCGWRMVQLESIGRKWAKIREVATGTPVRLPARVWPTFKAQPVN